MCEFNCFVGEYVGHGIVYGVVPSAVLKNDGG